MATDIARSFFHRMAAEGIRLDAGLFDTVFNLAALGGFDSFLDVHRHGTELGVGHQTLGTKHLAETTDQTHHVGRGDAAIEVDLAALDDFEQHGDHLPVVLGGLLQEGFTNDQDKVPVLGDTPFIGNLFRYDTRKRSKTNLMIFLRPTVLRNASQAGALSNERYRTLGMDQESVSPEARFALPAMTNPGLPLSTPAIPASAIPAPTNASQPVAPARQ